MGEERYADEPGVGGAKPWQVIMTWGVILGVGAIVLTVLAPQLTGQFGTGSAAGVAAPYWVLALYSMVTVGLPPFSAAFIGAAMVMRHIDAHAPAQWGGGIPEGPKPPAVRAETPAD